MTDNDALWERSNALEESIAERLDALAVGTILRIETPSGRFVQYGAMENGLVCETGGSDLGAQEDEVLYSIGWCRPGDDEAESMQNYGRVWPLPAPTYDAAQIGVHALRDAYGSDLEDVQILETR
jgi:type III secretion system-like peptide-binding chaperone